YMGGVYYFTELYAIIFCGISCIAQFNCMATSLLTLNNLSPCYLFAPCTLIPIFIHFLIQNKTACLIILRRQDNIFDLTSNYFPE
ncbi:MAG: hypothetical protein ACRCT2_08625, partial [Plesiomonas shigelloides]